MKIFVGLLLILAVIVGITSINHPIILKWLTGSARIIGKPKSAKVFTNGNLNQNIWIFHVDKYWNGKNADYYIVYNVHAPSNSKLKFFCLNRRDQYAGRPSSTNIRDYDFIGGLLFQSETGGQFTPFVYGEKGYDFDPDLKFLGSQIKLNIPPTAPELKYDSLRIEL